MATPVLHAAGGPGYGLSFDGTDDRVQAGTGLFFTVTNSFTIELWANPSGWRDETVEWNVGITSLSGQRCAVFPDNGYTSYSQMDPLEPTEHAGAGLSIGFNGISVVEHGFNHRPTPLVDSTALSGWTHVALVYANRTPRLYLNGEMVRTGLTSTKAFVHVSASLGGSTEEIGSGNYEGLLDEVRVWSVPLSQAQIQANMNRSLSGSEPNLVVYYRCDEGTGTVLADHAPAAPGAHGGLANGPAWVPSGILPFSPLAETLPATVTGDLTNRLNGRFNPAGAVTHAWFEWGTTTNYGNQTPARLLGSGGSNTNLSEVVSGVTMGITYHFRAVASNNLGVALGSNLSFIPPVFTQVGSDLGSDLLTGYLTKLRFDNIGNSVNPLDLLNHPKYINDQHDFKSLRTDFSANDFDECDNCGYVVRGLFIPAASGLHTFYLSADDGAVLFLSVDEVPANKVQIAREPTWAARRNFIGEADGGGRGDPPVNRSPPIQLTAGARYFIEGAVKESDGEDHLEVAVQGPGDPPVANGVRPIFGNRIASLDLPGVAGGSGAWADYDNDGDLDFLLAGSKSWSSSVLVVYVHRNNGDGTFTDINGLPGVNGRVGAWGDYDNDGDLDILLVGEASSGPFARVYRNNGNDTFTDIGAGLPGARFNSVAWGDYDNDGRLDLLLTGGEDQDPAPAQIYRNNGNSTFTYISAGLPSVSNSSVAWGDYDNDGDLDILLAGRFRDANAPGNDGPTCRIYRNDGNGAFTDINAGLPGLLNGSVGWGDFDNDGDLDLLLTGATRYISAELRYEDPLARVYRNNGNGTFTDANAGLPGVYGSSVAWGDYDNDGRLDILLTGARARDPITHVTNRLAQVYRNIGNGTFSDISATLPGVANGSGAWGDFDNDGDLDILLTGYADSVVVTRVYRNNTPQANTPPSVPTGLGVALTANRQAVLLTWTAATDAQTPTAALSYNLRVGTTPGASDVMGPMAGAIGNRRLPQMGNAQLGVVAPLHYNPGTPYYWSVQAVDGAFTGSGFATEASFKIQPVITPSTATNILLGDLNGDGLVDRDELNTVLSNYYPTSPFLQMTNVAGLGGTNVTFALSNDLAGVFSVEYTTNLLDWLLLGPATPRYQFTDTNAPAEPQRYYRLRWP